MTRSKRSTGDTVSPESARYGRLFRLLAVALALFTTLGVFELVLRLTPLGRPAYRATPVAPEAPMTRHDRPDFRGLPAPVEKGPGVYRIVVVGDSFAWGFGVERDDAFPRRLERLLAPHVDWAELEVINWSRPGWTTMLELRSLDNDLEALAPDLVLWSYVLNDPEPSPRGERDGTQAHLVERRPQSGAGARVLEVCRACSTLWNASERVRVRHALVRYYRGLYANEEAWGRDRRQLKRFARQLRNMEVPMAIVIWPIFDSQLDGRYPYVDLHRKVGALAEEMAVPVLDLLGSYRGIDARRLAVVPFTDPHPNELAHRLAAHEIFDFLLEWRVIVPPPAPPARD